MLSVIRTTYHQSFSNVAEGIKIFDPREVKVSPFMLLSGKPNIAEHSVLSNDHDYKIT